MGKRRPLNSRERVPIKLPGNLTYIPSMNTHFSQGLDSIWSRFNLLKEATGFSTGKSVFLQETSCRSFGREEIDYGEEFEARSPLRRHATTLSFHPPLGQPPFTTIAAI